MPALEFLVTPADITRLTRLPGMSRPGRPISLAIEWHDTATADLAGQNLALSTHNGRWRLERLRPATPMTPPDLIAEATTLARLGHPIPGGIARAARLTVTRRRLNWRGEAGDVAIELLQARIGRTPEQARLRLQGAAPALATLAAQIAAALPARAPTHSVAEQALATSQGHPLPPPRLGAPTVSPGETVTDSFATILIRLTETMLHWASLIPGAKDPEPVHQMRVATRRLRSALSVYKKAIASPPITALAEPLKECAARLGTARDWDVFLDGTGAQLAETFPDDPRCAALLRAGNRRRRAAYAELHTFVQSPGFRGLAIDLGTTAAFRLWEPGPTPESPTPELLTQDTSLFAATVLTRRWKQVRKTGSDIADLPTHALHELRKDCKRLRYTAEFFGPLFPAKAGKRFTARLADLQEELGLLNDGAAIAGLMAQLGRPSYAAGLVEGFAAGHAGPARERIARAWKRFRGAAPFWPASRQ